MDIEYVDLVFNYDLPDTTNEYLVRLFLYVVAYILYSFIYVCIYVL